MAALILPTDAMAKVGNEFVHDSLRSAGSRAELFEGGRAEKVGPDAIQNHGSPEPFLFHRVGLGHPAERPTQNFTDALKLILRSRKGFKKIDRVAAVGVANVVFGKDRDRFHPRHYDGEKTATCSRLGATFRMSFKALS
jgi:hypothetical protein